MFETERSWQLVILVGLSSYLLTSCYRTTCSQIHISMAIQYIVQAHGIGACFRRSYSSVVDYVLLIITNTRIRSAQIFHDWAHILNKQIAS